MNKRQALGKGLASLLDGSNNKFENNIAQQAKKNIEIENDNQYIVDIEKIIPNKNQPRKIFKEQEIKELSQSIKENGLIQPLIVMKKGATFELIAGERRLRASKLAGLSKVPVVFKNISNKDKMIMALLENIQREDLNCVEEALAYFHIIDEYKLTQEEFAKKIGKDRSSVSNFLRILKLNREVIKLTQQELISFGHAKLLASIKKENEQLYLANKVVNEKLSVRQLEKLISNKNKYKKDELQKDNSKIDFLINKLEKNTGYNFNIKDKNNGSGSIVIKYSNEAEFNDIFEYLMR